MFSLDFTTDWSGSMFEVWKGQSKALIPLLVISVLFAGVAYILNSNLWTVGVAVAGLLVGTFIMLTATTGAWILIGKVWSKYAPEKYHVTKRLKEYPVKTRTGSVVFFTVLFFALVYFVYSLSPDASVTIEAGSQPLTVGLKEFMYVVLSILAVLLGSMWKEHIDIIKAFRDSDRAAADELDDSGE